MVAGQTVFANSLGKCRQSPQWRTKDLAAQWQGGRSFAGAAPMQYWMLLSAPFATAFYFAAFPDQLRTVLDWVELFNR